MRNTGIIVKLNKKDAIIFTKHLTYVNIKRYPGMYIGLEVNYSDSDVINNKKAILKYSCAAVFIIGIISFILYFNIINQNNSKDIYAYIDIDIYTSLELCVNKDMVVTSIKELDSKKIDSFSSGNYLNIPLNSAIDKLFNNTEIIKELENHNEKYIYVSTYINNTNNIVNSITIKNIFSNNKKSINSNISIKYLDINTDTRKLAKKNRISMGKYCVYESMISSKAPITINEAREKTLTEIIEPTKSALPSGSGSHNEMGKTTTPQQRTDNNHPNTIFSIRPSDSENFIPEKGNQNPNEYHPPMYPYIPKNQWSKEDYPIENPYTTKHP